MLQMFSINKIGELFISSAKQSFSRKTIYSRNPKNKPRYGSKCRNTRVKYNTARKKYNTNKCIYIYIYVYIQYVMV